MGKRSRAHSEGWCPNCHRQVRTSRPPARSRLHVTLALATLGLWALVRLFFTARGRAWRCAECGHVTSRYG